MNKNNKAELYELLDKLNKAIKENIGHYDLGSPILQNFLSINDIKIDSLGKRNIKKYKSQHNFILVNFESANSKSKITDKAHDVLRHLRNSLAHSLVFQKGKNEYQLIDKNKADNESMNALIRKDLLFTLVDEIMGTYH